MASIYLFKPSYAIGSVPSVSGRAIAYRWRSLARVRRHRANDPQGSFKRVLSWQVTMNQLICASLSIIFVILSATKQFTDYQGKTQSLVSDNDHVLCQSHCYRLKREILSTYLLHTKRGCGKRQAHINWSMVMQRQRHPLLELLLLYVVIRLDVAAKAGVGRCEANRLMHKVHGTKVY